MDKLDRDVREALRLGYGVHYGLYKVDHPHTKDDFEDLPPEPKYKTRKCPECETEFIPGRKDQRYCTDDCRNRHHMRVKYQKEKSVQKPELLAGPAICPVCGTEFIRKLKGRQETCSRSCSATANNLRRYSKKTKEETT